MTMTKTRKTILSVLGGLVFVYFALSLFTTEGEVVDDKGKPIKGAVVLATWNGVISNPVQANTQCYHVESTTTDENGRFRMPIFSRSLNPFYTDRIRGIDVFVPGYYLTPSPNRDDDHKYRFAPIELVGTKSEQFEIVNRRNMGGGCKGNQNARLLLMKAVHTELSRLATTNQDKERCEAVLYDIEDVEFGSEIADERRIKRRIQGMTHSNKGISK
jgi:hypothetical protein